MILGTLGDLSSKLSLAIECVSTDAVNCTLKLYMRNEAGENVIDVEHVPTVLSKGDRVTIDGLYMNLKVVGA